MNKADVYLTHLGLSEYEARAYTALLSEHPLTAYEVAKKSGIPSSKIYEVMRKLDNRSMVQAIHGERSRSFIPVPPEEFISNYRSHMEESLDMVGRELSGIEAGMDTSYTWHIKDYEGLLLKASRMIHTAETSLIIQLWQEEMNILYEALENAEERGVKIAILHYGATNLKVGQVYKHPVEGSIFTDNNSRGCALVADSKEALIGKISDRNLDIIWSMNKGFVLMAEDYIRHDIYFIKTARRFAPLLKARFGENFEKLRDIFSDDIPL
ncbi:MAG: TrmB family transcriptional regulator [Nitrospiraceae bacterium]|nr:MAG: TrmB family transcriptional regulator [Nitrospiraceae bacterium]